MRLVDAARFTVLGLSLLAPLSSQPVSIGVKAGVPFSEEFKASQAWTIGPTVEFRLPARFSLGVDALYRKADVDDRFNDLHVALWEVPVFVKYRFTDGRVRPFVAGGIALNHAKTTGYSGSTPQGYEIRNSEWGLGFLVGGGVEFKAGRLTIAPELRYTRWQRGYLSGAGPDQAVLLVGLRF